MVFDHLRKVHLIQLIAGKYQHIVELEMCEVAVEVPYGIRIAREPFPAIVRLLCCKDFHKRVIERREIVRVFNMRVERRRIVLREDKYAVQARIEAVRYGYIHQAVFSSQRNRWL